MEVNVNSGTEARKLELDGYERIGKKRIMTGFSELRTLLDRGDVTVTTVTLNRMAGGDEADVIDEYVKAGVASDYGGSISRVSFSARTGPRGNSIQRKSTDILEAKEDTLTVNSDFEKALLDGPVVEHKYNVETFESARETVIEALDKEIEQTKQYRQQVSDMTPEEV